MVQYHKRYQINERRQWSNHKLVRTKLKTSIRSKYSNIGRNRKFNVKKNIKIHSNIEEMWGKLKSLIKNVVKSTLGYGGRNDRIRISQNKK